MADGRKRGGKHSCRTHRGSMLADWLLRRRRAAYNILCPDAGALCSGRAKPLQHVRPGESVCDGCLHSDVCSADDRADACHTRDVVSPLVRRTVCWFGDAADRDDAAVHGWLRAGESLHGWLRAACRSGLDDSTLYELSPRSDGANQLRGSRFVQRARDGAVCTPANRAIRSAASRASCVLRPSNDDDAHDHLHADDHGHAGSSDNVGSWLQLPQQHFNWCIGSILDTEFEQHRCFRGSDY